MMKALVVVWDRDSWLLDKEWEKAAVVWYFE